MRITLRGTLLVDAVFEVIVGLVFVLGSGALAAATEWDAPVLFVLLWSTGFIGARYGLPYIEPLTFLAVRMFFVVVIMAAIAIIGGAKPPDAGEIAYSLVAGSLVHGLYLGGVFTAISQGVPAGISARLDFKRPGSPFHQNST